MKIPARSMSSTEVDQLIREIRAGVLGKTLTTSTIVKYMAVYGTGDESHRRLEQEILQTLIRSTLEGLAIKVPDSLNVVAMSKNSAGNVHMAYGGFDLVSTQFNKFGQDWISRYPSGQWLGYITHQNIQTNACIKCGQRDTLSLGLYNQDYLASNFKKSYSVRFSAAANGNNDAELLAAYNMKTQGMLGAYAVHYVRILGVCKNCKPVCDMCAMVLHADLGRDELINLLQFNCCTTCSGGQLSTVAHPKPSKRDLVRLRQQFSLKK